MRQLPAGAAPNPQPDAVICDMDGTLCDVRAIRHLVEKPDGVRHFKADFYRFHLESHASPAYPGVVEALRRLNGSGLAIVVVSGREAGWFSLTASWLREHGVHYDDLFLRPAKDYRPDVLIKSELLATVNERYHPRIALDDRDDVIELWKSASIPTIRVNADGRLFALDWPDDTWRQFSVISELLEPARHDQT